MERKKASDYPQELLDLFHEYQHGDIDRRAFLERAAKFAVGGLTAAAILSEMRPNYAWAQQVPKDDPRIKVEVVTVQSPQGNGTIKGVFARPAKASGKLPGILVIHENRGLNPYVEDVARRFAAGHPPIVHWQGIPIREGKVAPLIEGAVGWIEARVVAEHDVGDHTFFVGEVVTVEDGPATHALVYRDREYHAV